MKLDTWFLNIFWVVIVFTGFVVAIVFIMDWDDLLSWQFSIWESLFFIFNFLIIWVLDFYRTRRFLVGNCTGTGSTTVTVYVDTSTISLQKLLSLTILYFLFSVIKLDPSYKMFYTIFCNNYWLFKTESSSPYFSR